MPENVRGFATDSYPKSKIFVAETKSNHQVGASSKISDWTPTFDQIEALAKSFHGLRVVIPSPDPAAERFYVGQVIDSPSRDLASEGWWYKYEIIPDLVLSKNRLAYHQLPLAIACVQPAVRLAYSVDGLLEPESVDAVLTTFSLLVNPGHLFMDRYHKIYQCPIKRMPHAEIRHFLLKHKPFVMEMLNEAILIGDRTGAISFDAVKLEKFLFGDMSLSENMAFLYSIYLKMYQLLYPTITDSVSGTTVVPRGVPVGTENGPVPIPDDLANRMAAIYDLAALLMQDGVDERNVVSRIKSLVEVGK